MEKTTVLYVLMTAGIVALVYLLGTYASSSYKRKVLRQSINCLMGNHKPGLIKDAVGGRRVQHCDYCDKRIREYQVTKSQVQGERDTIRRI